MTLAAILLGLGGAPVGEAQGLNEESTPTLGLHTTQRAPVAFVGGRVVVAPGSVVDNATLTVRDGRVASVVAGGAVDPGVRSIDVQGKTLYPGFVDPYTEYGLPAAAQGPPGSDGPQYEADRQGGEPWNAAIHSHVRWVDQFRPDGAAAEALLTKGFTAVQSARLDGIFRGVGFAASLGEGRPDELVLKSQTLQFASFDPGASAQAYPSSLMGSIALVRQTLLDAAWYGTGRRQPDGGPNLDRALEALAANRGPIVFETDDEHSLLRAERIARELDETLIHVGSGREWERIEAVSELSQPLILAPSYPKAPSVATLDDALDVTLTELRRWDRAPRNPLELHEAGVRFAWTNHGLRSEESFWDNVREAVERGLDPAVAVAALTTVPAEIVGIEQQAGTLEVGKRADLVIADGDLLVDGAIQEIWVDGRKRHTLTEVNPTDWRGEYSLTAAGHQLLVTIEGEIGKPNGILKRGEEESKLRGVVSDRRRIAFLADLSDGVLRGSLLAADPLRGQIAFPDGQTANARVERTELDADDDSSESGSSDQGGQEKGEESGSPTPSRRTFPSSPFGYEAQPQAEDVLFRNATVWTNEAEGVLEGTDLFVRGGKIAAVGSGLDVPDGVRIVDATGLHLTPGMIDEHAHIAIAGGVNEGSHAVTSEVRIGDVVNPDHIGIYRALAGGTTAAQLLHGSANPIGGQAQVIKLRWGADAEDLKFEAAPPSIKFALGENVKQSNWGDDFRTRYPQTRMGVETTMRDRFRAAQEYGRRWEAYEAEPEGRRGPPPRRDLQLEALWEILNEERFVHCHSYVQSEILMLLRLAEEFGFQVQTFTHVLEGYKVAPELAAHGAGASTFADWWAYKFEVYDAIPQNACLMNDAGVVTSINSDSADLIRRLNHEAAKSVQHCGMSEEDALKLATLNPAIQLGIDDRVGSLAVGKDADLVLWDAHPLSVLARVEQTWVDGTEYYSRERDAQVQERAHAERLALVQRVLESDAPQGEAESQENEDSEEWHCEEVVDVWHTSE